MFLVKVVCLGVRLHHLQAYCRVAGRGKAFKALKQAAAYALVLIRIVYTDDGDVELVQVVVAVVGHEAHHAAVVLFDRQQAGIA